ncbi:hypothetical protein ABK040_012682 [Willaertia magna]
MSEKITVKIIDLPFELHNKILDYLISSKDGLNYLKLFNENNKTSKKLFKTHLLFTFIRISTNEIQKWKEYYKVPIFGDGKISFQFSCNNKNDEEDSEEESENSDNEEEERRIKKRKKELKNTQEEVYEHLLKINKSLKSIIKDYSLTNIYDRNNKILEWTTLLQEITKDYSSKVANNLYELIFSKITLLHIKTKYIDYHNYCKAVIKINDNLILIHEGYDDKGYKNSYWNIRYSKDVKYEAKNIGATVCWVEENDFLLYKSDIVKEMREKCFCNKIVKEVDDSLLIKCLIYALPWQWGSNVIYYDEIGEE